jgi:hypothetical protein
MSANVIEIPFHKKIGWVDIGTRARVPLRIVVYLKKIGKMRKN